MSATGDLLHFVLCGLLLIPPLLMLPRIIRDRNTEKLKGHLKWMFLLSIPFLMLYGEKKICIMKEGLERKGIYLLTDYPNCPNCELELKSWFRYEVRNGNTIIESGKWKYRRGGDYWITYIGQNGQLGADNFKYKRKNN